MCTYYFTLTIQTYIISIYIYIYVKVFISTTRIYMYLYMIIYSILYCMIIIRWTTAIERILYCTYYTIYYIMRTAEYYYILTGPLFDVHNKRLMLVLVSVYTAICAYGLVYIYYGMRVYIYIYSIIIIFSPLFIGIVRSNK